MDLAFLVIERPRRGFRSDHAFFRAEVEDLRSGTLLRLAHHERLALHNAGHFTGGVVQVAEDAALGRTDADARGLELVLDPVRAEVALLRGPGVRIDEELIVGAGFHAGAAADAGRAVEIDDPVAPLEERIGRADADARGFVALVAQNGEEQPLRVRERSLLDRLDPAAVHADRDLVLGLARDRAGMTADALSQIDRKAEISQSGLTIAYA